MTKNEGWQKEYAELKTFLTPEEYRETRATVTTAFYTPPEVAATIGEALVQFGFRGGNVLEPSMGTGHVMQDNFMVKFPKLIAAAEEKLKCVHEDVRERDGRLVAGADFSIQVGGMTFTERVDGGTVFLSAVSQCKTGQTTGGMPGANDSNHDSRK